MRIIAGAVGLMVATGHLCARVESPVVSLDKPLPSEALALTCPASGTSEPETSAPGAFRTANLSAADSQSLWAALSEARREIGAVGDAADGALLRAHNPGQRLAVRFMPNAVSVAPSGTNAAWQAFFALDGTAGQPAAVVCRGTRMEYDRGSLIEWYDNQAGGVEHGFILKTRPAGAGPDVRLRVAVGGLQPRLSSDGDAAELADGQGNVLLRYAKLKAWDADGRVLASRMEVGDGAVVLVVADAGARYPVTIDPFITAQQAKLGPEVTGDGAAEDCFGYSVALSGDTALVGAYQDDDKGANSGSAYVFTRDGTTWSQQAKLIADDGAIGDWFGTSVALSGDIALVGAYADDDKGTDSGSAYVFTRDGTTWTQQAKLIADDGAKRDYFGWSVALSGDTALVGAYQDDGLDALGGAAADQGSAYVFTLVDDITVTLDYQYGGITNTLILQTSGTYASLPSATRPLHTFLGWYRTPTNTLEDIQNGVDNRIYPTNTVECALATLYARWSPFTATRTTPISIRVTALAPFYPGDISQAFPDEVEAYASGNAAAAAYKVWELILLGLNPTDPDVVPTAILAYITFDGNGDAVVHKIPAVGIPSATIYKQWGKQNLADPAWTDLGAQGTPCPPSQPYRFFKITGE